MVGKTTPLISLKSIKQL